MIKLFTIFSFIVLYFWLFGFSSFATSAYFHILGIVLVSIWFMIRYTFKEFVNAIVFLLPLVVVFGLFGVLFQVFEVGGRTDWLEDTLIKVLFLPASVLYIRVVLSYITFYDIAGLKFSDSIKRDLVIFRTIVVRGNGCMERLKWYIDNNQLHFGQSFFYNNIPKYSALILSTYISLYQKAEILYTIIENRTSYLNRSDKE